MAKRVSIDWMLFSIVAVMVSLGFVMIYSTSSITAQALYNKQPHYFVVSQIAWAALGFTALLLMRRFPYKKLNSPQWAFGAIGAVLFLLPIAFVVDARHRWIPLGIGNLQPSEFAKPALAIFLAYFVTWRQRAINDPKFTLRPAALVLGLLFFFVALGDLGTAIVLGVVAVGVFFVAGLERKYLAFAAGLAIACVTVAIVAAPHRFSRVVRLLDPDLEFVENYDPTGKIKPYIVSSAPVSDTNYQATQAKIAIGSGGVFGVGPGHGRQKHFFLPDSHTDFIYAIIGEELGLWGTTAVLAGYLLIIWRGLRIFWLTTNEFGRYLALGLTIAIGFQALVNMSVVLGLGPTKGIPLPMISYGGSSLLSTLASLGILLNISEQAG
ncbi:MAG: putative lipid II flippase FtsW [Acidobacteria bacterium]|nr:putative lipid II flippase FtsW [Acidobacteriota bacterium]